MVEGGAGRSIKIRSAALSKKLSGEMSGGKGRRHWRRRSRMSNRLKPLIGKEGEKEIKSTEKKKRKWRRWRGERGCDHGRLEAASENDGAGTGHVLGASGGHGRQGVGKMGEEETARERESKVAKASERIGDWKMGGGDGGQGEKGPGRRIYSSFCGDLWRGEGRGGGVRAEASQKERRRVARSREVLASVVAAERESNGEGVGEDGGLEDGGKATGGRGEKGPGRGE